jgi:hypothetical protein
MFRVTSLILVAVLTTAGTAFAQRRGPLAKALSTESVRLALPPAQDAAPPPAQKTSHPVRKGFLIGSAVGIAVGIVSMNSAIDNCPSGRSCSTAPVGVPFYMLLGAGVGSVIGWVFAK